MNSCLYETQIMHHRFTPKEHKFSYGFFSFYLDLDEIDNVCRKVFLMSRNRFNAYCFYDRDHLDKENTLIKEKILGYLHDHGIDLPGGRVMLLTYLRTLGYVFNPVSFYFCYDSSGRPLCVVPEIGNTFGEIKPFFIGQNELQGNSFKSSQSKYYYISPFNKLDDTLDFSLAIPNENLSVSVDTSRDGKKVIVTHVKGKRLDLTNANLIKETVKFPLVTLKVIFLIHWHALLLWLKKIPHEEKTSNEHLQKELFHAWHKS